MDDAALVDAARRGDDGAWGAIYDRYADKLHDHCFRIVRDRGDAEDALHDAFIAAARNLHQLREPSRLRPWLYAICRHEALRYARQRGRVDLTDEVGEMSDVEVDPVGGSNAEEIKELVWSAAEGLNPRDQALLDLSLRQRLEGQDLADAIGTSLNNSYVMLSRLRDQVERSLGALLIARLGREDCDDLATILEGWDGTFSPLLRKRVARHVDSCEVCERKRAAVASPLALLATAPLVPAPSSLRSRVLDGIGSGAAPAAPISFTAAGFPRDEPDQPPLAPRIRLAVAGLLALLAAVLLVAFLLGQGDDTTGPIAAEGTTSTTDGSTTSASTTTTEATTSTSTTSTSTTQPETPPASEDPVVVPPSSTPPADTAGPSISGVSASPSTINLTCAASGPYTSTISASVTDASTITVTLLWSGDPGAGTAAMARSGGAYRASLGDFDGPAGGTVTYRVRAVDAAGNTTTSSPHSIDVTPCPG